MLINCTAIDTSALALANNSDLEDERTAIHPQDDDGNASTHEIDDNNGDGDASTHENDENNDGNDGNSDLDVDANKDEDNYDNFIAGPTILARVEMAKTARKYILKFLYLCPTYITP